VDGTLLQRLQSLLIGARSDDLVVVLQAGIEVVVVSGQPRVSQTLRLLVCESIWLFQESQF